VEAAAAARAVVLVTKGDLLDQERKLAQSGLGELFDAVEIVSDKTAETYRSVFARHGQGPERAAMVGNSLRSDVYPAIASGAWGVHIPHENTWSYETDVMLQSHDRLRMIADLSGLETLLNDLDGSS
jgi:putative hydrolase of the HAD superfamily